MRRTLVESEPVQAKRELSDQQRRAIGLLVEGKTDPEVAEGLGVQRAMLARWRRYDVAFRAELNRRRQEVWGDAADRLRALVPRAVQKLSEALESSEQSWQVALAVLKVAGMVTPGRPHGATDADGLLDELVKAKRPDPLDAFTGGGPVTDRERAAVLAELEAERQAGDA